MKKSKESKAENKLDILRFYWENYRKDKIVCSFFCNDILDDFFNSRLNYLSTFPKFGSLEEDDKFAILSNVFNIKLPKQDAPEKNYALFKSRFYEAAYGNGNEIRHITQFNSSALAALMCFYNINAQNPIDINIDGHMLHLTSVVLEKENPVFKGPSCIDVALYGSNEKNEKVVLFLESKFGEYLKQSKNYEAAGRYKEYYEKLSGINKEVSTGLRFEAGNKNIIYYSDKGKHYFDGIKQMISHYIGATKSYELNVEKRKVYLGTILFDFSDGIIDKDLKNESKGLLDDYKRCYGDIAKLLNKLSENNKETEMDKVTVIENAFTYQDFFKQNPHVLDADVKKFYQL